MSNLVLEIFAQVVGELEIMDASVDRGIRTVSGVDFAHDRETRKEIGQTVWRQAGATRGELEEGLPFRSGKVN